MSCRSIIVLLLLVSSYCATAQDLKELEEGIRHTYINDYKSMRRKADKIYQLDPFNEVATAYLTTSFSESGLQDSIDALFTVLKSIDASSAKPYVLAAKYQYRDAWPKDTFAIKELRAGVAIDTNIIEAYNLLGALYYSKFIEQPSSYYAFACRDYFLKAFEKEKDMYVQLMYPIIQTSVYLNDTVTVNLFRNYQYQLAVDSQNVPKLYAWYFPLSKFLALPDGWERDTTLDLMRKVSDEGFTLSWYSEQLRALEEPVIYNQTDKVVYRFTWLRSFHHPVAIRIENVGNDYILFWKMADGAGGDKPGQLMVSDSRKLTTKEWASFMELINSSEFWRLPVTAQQLGTDGAKWLFEGLSDRKYHIVERWTPQNNYIEKMGKYLMSLTTLKIPAKDVY